MKTLFGFSALLISLFWAPEAAAYSLSHKLYCVNDFKYVYYTENEAMAKKCKYNFDNMCNWKSTGLNCRWDEPGSGYKLKEEEKPKPKPKATSPATATAAQTETAYKSEENSYSFNLGGKGNFETEEENPKVEAQKEEEVSAAGMEAAKAAAAKAATAKAEIEQAKKEAQAAAAKVEEMKLTMEEIRVNNENNAILYRSPDADVGSVDARFNAFNAGLSGDLGASDSSGAVAGGLLGGALKNAPGMRSTKNTNGRTIASSGSAEIDIAKDGDKAGASTDGESNSATSDNPWVNYMGQTTMTGLIDRLRKNPSLRESLRERIAELQAKGDNSGVIELMEETLASAEKESQEPNLDNLKPVAMSEVFSMDSTETEAQIRSLLADLDSASDPQFLPQVSLFERVSVAHRRSLLRGTLKSTR